ncbi:MAG: hypothetical protein RMK32_04620 [Anaerolineae bacterium]|nr:hypothetical protein [Anaerolineae bacterium]
MISRFLEALGERLSERSAALAFTPAFLFWGGGALILAGRYGPRATWEWLARLTPAEQVLLLALVLFLLLLSTAVAGRLRYPLLRLLEGYWPGPLRQLSVLLGKAQARRLQQRRLQWNQLKAKEKQGDLSPAERRLLAELDLKNHYYPADEDDCLPTALGNALRSAETAVWHRYGLDAVAIWPYLWLLLPESVQKELSAARSQLDTLVELWFWGFLFLVWTALWPWAALIALVWMGLAYRFAVEAARTFADLFLAAFTLHRFALYDALGWPRPSPEENEAARGARLSEYLWRGF